MAEPVRVFVSHSHSDNDYCRKYVEGLRTQGYVVWYDEHNLGWGELRKAIQSELERSQHFVAILSPTAGASPWVNREIDAAISLSDQGQLDSVIFVVAERCKIPLLLNSWKRIEMPGGAAISPGEAVTKTVSIIGTPVLPEQPILSDVASTQAQQSLPLHPVASEQPHPTLSRRNLLIGAGVIAATAAGAGAIIKAHGSLTGIIPPGAQPTATATLPTVAPRWHFGLAGFAAFQFVPTLANDLLFVGLDSVNSGTTSIYALDTSSGTARWHFDTDIFAATSPAIANGVLFVGSNDGIVYALDASKGTQRWQKTVVPKTVVFTLPTIANGLLFAVSGDESSGDAVFQNDTIYALDAGTGTLGWHFDTGGIGANSPTSPRIANGLLFVGSSAKTVYALDASKSTPRWHFDTDDGISGIGSLTVANGLLYLNALDGTVYALDASNGAQRWHFDTGVTDVALLRAANDLLLVAPDNRTVYALDANNGTLHWKRLVLPDSASGSNSLSSLAAANGLVFVGTYGGAVYALNASSGAPLWRFDTGSHDAPLSLTAANGLLFIGSDNGVFALDVS